MLMHGIENWVMNRYERRKFEPAEMRFLRSVSQCILADTKRNIDEKIQKH